MCKVCAHIILWHDVYPCCTEKLCKCWSGKKQFLERSSAGALNKSTSVAIWDFWVGGWWILKDILCTRAVLLTSRDPSSGIHIVTLLLYKCKEAALFTVQCNVRLEYALFSETPFVCWHCSPVHFSVHHFNLIPRSSTPSCPLFN